MKILSIDFGSYSIKFLEAQFERKILIYENFEEVIIDDYLSSLPVDTNKEDAHYLIVRDYLRAHGIDKKKVIQIPTKLTTTRFINLPVSNRRKAEQMIPFQLDRELPFSINEIQYASQLINLRSSMYAISSAVDLSKFDTFYKKLESFSAIPDIITSEVSLYQSFISQQKWENSNCIIDIGHETTKVYFSVGSRIVASHMTYFGGKNITEIIAQTYQISMDEAKKFKHEKSFFLTEDQYEQVDDNQKEFAKLMKKIFSPLIGDIKRWELGHRIAYGESIKEIYLGGGTSGIKNICNFFTETLVIPTEHFNPYDPSNFKKITLTEQTSQSSITNHLMASGINSQLPLINLRYGSYASADQSDLPLHTSAFIGLRVALLVLLIAFSFFVERIFLLRQENNLDAHNIKLIKRQELNIPKKDQRVYKTKPQVIAKKIQERYKEIENEIKLIESVSKTDAVAILFQINKYLKASEEFALTKYDNNNQFVHLEFRANSLEKSTQLIDQLKSLPFNDLKIGAPIKQETEKMKEKTPEEKEADLDSESGSTPPIVSESYLISVDFSGGNN